MLQSKQEEKKTDCIGTPLGFKGVSVRYWTAILPKSQTVGEDGLALRLSVFGITNSMAHFGGPAELVI